MRLLEHLLLPFFVAVAAIWLLSGVYLLAGRAVYDWRRRRLRRVADWLAERDNVMFPAERTRRLKRNLREIPKKTLEAVSADASSPERMAEACAHYLVQRWGFRRWVEEASSHRGAFGKWRRIRALRLLSRARYDGMLPLLGRALGERDPDVVGAAVVILGGMKSVAAAELLVDALRRELHPPSRVATQLHRFPVPLLDLLLPLSESPSSTVRYWAATLVSRYPRTEWVEERLVQLTKDREPLVRKAAVQTLGVLGGEAAARAASNLLDDPEWMVRAHAARAIGQLDRPDLASRVKTLLADREWWVRTAAKDTLTAMGAEAWDELVPMLDHPDRFARNGAAEVLQHGGWLDRLVQQAAGEREGSASWDVLRKVLSAGEPRLVSSVAWRARDVPGVTRLLQELGFERAAGEASL